MQESANTRFTVLANTRFTVLVGLIREVRPSLVDVEIAPENSVVDDLGLDSLDLLQLSRRIRREIGQELDLDSWTAGQETHHMSVQSILDSLRATTAV